MHVVTELHCEWTVFFCHFNTFQVPKCRVSVSWEPEGHYRYSRMFRWEPEGRYCMYKIYGDSTFLVLKGTSFNSVNALLVLSRRVHTLCSYRYNMWLKFNEGKWDKRAVCISFLSGNNLKTWCTNLDKNWPTNQPMD